MATNNTDVIITGGGPAGLTMGLALGSAGLNVTIIEGRDPSTLNAETFDGRCSAVSHAGSQIFAALGAWDDMAHYAGPMLDIRLVDEDSPAFLHYDHSDLGDEPMGYMLENRYMRRALYDAVMKQRTVTLLAPRRVEDISIDSHNAEVTLDNGDVITAKLLIAADGRNSVLREQAGIHTVESDYKQTAIIATLKHEKHHEHVAVEKFLPAGPFALLPLRDGYHSSIVWTEKTELVETFKSLSDADLLKQIEPRFGDHWGALELVGPRYFYPLSLTFAREYVRPRLCLVGDAAHAIHPIAGQGFNLTLRDIAVLAELIVDAARIGLDIGDMGHLKQYESLRRSDNMKMIAATDTLNRLFSNNIIPLKLARRTGLAAIQRMPKLKNQFMEHAMGMDGDLPRLVRGEAL